MRLRELTTQFEEGNNMLNEKSDVLTNRIKMMGSDVRSLEDDLISLKLNISDTNFLKKAALEIESRVRPT